MYGFECLEEPQYYVEYIYNYIIYYNYIIKIIIYSYAYLIFCQ